MAGELLALWLLDWQAASEAATTARASSLLRGLTEKLFSSMDLIPCIPVFGARQLGQIPNFNDFWSKIASFGSLFCEYRPLLVFGILAFINSAKRLNWGLMPNFEPHYL